MSEGISRVTIRRLEKVRDALDDQGLACWPVESLLVDYSELLAVREDMRQQGPPIGGRYIGPEDRKAVDDALDALHSAIMWRYESDDYAIMEALDRLIEYLKQAVEQKGEAV